MSLNIRLITVDLDGTLLNSQSEVPLSCVEAIKDASCKGVHIILNSTRNKASMLDIANQLSIKGPLICSNGAEIWESPTGALWFCDTIPEAVYRAAYSLAQQKQWKVWTDMFSEKEHIFIDPPEDGYLDYLAMLDKKPVGKGSRPIVMYLNHPDSLKAIPAFCLERFGGACRVEYFYNRQTTPQVVGIFGKHADKGRGLKLVMEKLGITPNQVLAIGDGPPDIPMFKHAAISVAVGNAKDMVKKAANHIGPDNDSNGVAWAVRKFAL